MCQVFSPSDMLGLLIKSIEASPEVSEVRRNLSPAAITSGEEHFLVLMRPKTTHVYVDVQIVSKL
jgi:hypothetical protein